MRRAFGLKQFMTVLVGLAFIATAGLSDPITLEKVPEPVAKTFRTMFPNGVIEKLDAEEEDGVMVYDFEFRAGGREKETDISADGTMLESTLVVTAKAVPAPALKSIQAAAKGAKLGRLEWFETRYQLKEGKIIALATPEIHYAAEMTRRNQKAEVQVTPDGKVTAAPEWVSSAPAKTAPSAKTGK